MSKEKNTDVEEGKLSFVADLNLAKDLWSMKVRILRKWEKFGKLELVLIDEKGAKIQASSRPHLFKVFDGQLAEDDVVILNKFGVGENKDKDEYKVIPHDMKVSIYHSTVVDHVHGWQGVEYGFNFINFTNILKGKAIEHLTVDVAGSVIWCGDMDVFGKPPKESKRINFDLENLEGTILRCTMWYRYAEQFQKFITENNSNEHVMAIIQHAKVKEWKENFTVQSDKYGTRLFLNQEIDEVNKLRRSLIAKQRQKTGSTSQIKLSSQTVFPLYQEFVKDTVQKHVDEVTEIEEAIECVVVGTIKIVEEDYSWFYVACRKCFKKVLTKSEYLETAKKVNEELLKLPATALICPKYDCEAKSITTKFKVQVRVQDETGSLSFVMFDRDVMRIVGTSASDVRERQVKANETETFPHELCRLIEKKLALKIEISDYNLDRDDYNIFTVQKTCDDPQIIAELEVGDDNANETTNEVTQQDDSRKDMKLSESSQGFSVRLTKDVASFTEDSSVVEALKDSATSPNGKRTLEETETQDKNGDLSSTNKRARRKSFNLNN